MSDKTLPGTIELDHVETKHHYTVTPSAEMVLRNGHRSLFHVRKVVITHDPERGARHIECEGTRVKTGTWTRTGFGVMRDGTINAEREIPRWLTDLLGWYQANHQPGPRRVNAYVPAGSDRFA